MDFYDGHASLAFDFVVLSSSQNANMNVWGVLTAKLRGVGSAAGGGCWHLAGLTLSGKQGGECGRDDVFVSRGSLQLHVARYSARGKYKWRRKQELTHPIPSSMAPAPGPASQPGQSTVSGCGSGMSAGLRSRRPPTHASMIHPSATAAASHHTSGLVKLKDQAPVSTRRFTPDTSHN
ncbi:hypothetical protein ACLOJK_001782 [Asimina triloba]